MPTVDVLHSAFHPSWCLGRELVNIADFPNSLGSGDAFWLRLLVLSFTFKLDKEPGQRLGSQPSRAALS
jgi:hypothetical protein